MTVVFLSTSQHSLHWQYAVHSIQTKHCCWNTAITTTETSNKLNFSSSVRQIDFHSACLVQARVQFLSKHTKLWSTPYKGGILLQKENALCALKSNKPEPLYALCSAHGSLGPFPQAGGRQSTVNITFLPRFGWPTLPPDSWPPFLAPNNGPWARNLSEDRFMGKSTADSQGLCRNRRPS